MWLSRSPTSSHRRLAVDRLTDLEAFELRMFQIERSCRLIASTRMRSPELVRLGPGLEGALALPHGVRGVEDVIVSRRPFEEVEFDKARYAIEIGIAVAPNFLESFF